MDEYVIVECRDTTGLVAWGRAAKLGTWAPILRTQEIRRRDGEIRKVIAYRPAVPGYAFIPRASFADLLLSVPERFGMRVMRTPEGRPHLCHSSELVAMQRALNDEYEGKQRPALGKLRIGARVRVTCPPFEGYEGKIVSRRRTGIRCEFGPRFITLPASFLQVY